MGSWICDGIPKDGKQHTSSGAHSAYENYGPDCVICGLPQSAVVLSSIPKKSLWVIIAMILGLIGIIGTGFFLFRTFSPSPKPQTQTNQPNQGTTPNPPVSTNPPVFTTYPTFRDVPNVSKGTFNYGGSTTWAPLRAQQITTAINQAHPDFQLRYTEPPPGKEPGSGTGIQMLLANQLSFSQSSRPVKVTEFQEAVTRNFKLKEVPVAIDAIAFYVNPKLYQQLQQLTVAQIQDIYTGKITNWQKVGGPNLPIVPFSRDLQAGGTVDYFYEEILQETPFGLNVQTNMRDTTDSIRQVGSNEGAIGYATISEVINQRTISILSIAAEQGKPFIFPCGDGNCTYVNKTALSNGDYPITRRLFVVIKEDGGLDQQAGEAYVNLMLSDEGQQLIEQSGFVAIR